MAEGSKTCCSQARVIWLGHLYVGFSLILGLAWIRGTAPVARVQGWLRNAATQRQLQGFVSGGVCSTLEVWHWGWAPLNVLSDRGPGFTNPKISAVDTCISRCKSLLFEFVLFNAELDPLFWQEIRSTATERDAADVLG